MRRQLAAFDDHRERRRSLEEDLELGTAMLARYFEWAPGVERGRLGGATWGTGRGAAPPQFGPHPPSARI
jgi:hypothetical protein